LLENSEIDKRINNLSIHSILKQSHVFTKTFVSTFNTVNARPVWYTLLFPHYNPAHAPIWLSWSDEVS